MSFDGTQYVKITLPDESRTEGEEISLRFRTDRPNGLLFATSARGAVDRMELNLVGGKIRLEINLGSGRKVGQTMLIPSQCYVNSPIASQR